MFFVGPSVLCTPYTAVLRAGGLHLPVECDPDGDRHYIALFGAKDLAPAELTARTVAFIKGYAYSPFLFTPIQTVWMSVYPVGDKWCPVIILTDAIRVLIAQKAAEEGGASTPISNTLKVATAISQFLANDFRCLFDPTIGMILHYSIEAQHIPSQQVTSALWHELRFQP